MQETIIIALIIFAAALTQGAAGFGSAMVSMALLPFFLDVKTAVPLVAINGLIITASIFFRLRKSFNFKRILPLTLGSFFGLGPGIYFLKHADAALVKGVLGVFLIIYSLYTLFVKDLKVQGEKLTGFLFGIVSGCLGGAFTTNGPPAIIYASMQDWDRDETAVTLQAYFFISACILVAAYSAGGLVTHDVLSLWIKVLPGLAAGLAAGAFIYRRLSTEAFRKAVLALLLVLGGLLVFR